MLGLVITLAAATVSLPQGQTAGLACVEGPSACEAAPAPEGADPFEATFATPAVIDCRREVLPLVLSTLVGECDGTPHDASYRVSRAGDEEGIDGIAKSLAPAPRERSTSVATCGGVPQRPPTLQLLDAQMLALSQGASVLAPPETGLRRPRDALELSTRFADPPDRPPRV
jgi:hypothetical protein